MKAFYTKMKQALSETTRGLSAPIRDVFAPLAKAWEAWEDACMDMTRYIIALPLIAFGLVVFFKPDTFDTDAYKFLLSWASAKAWGLVGAYLGGVMVYLPSRERVAIRLCLFAAAAYCLTIAIAIASTPRGITPMAAYLMVVGLIAFLASSRVAQSDAS